MKEEQIDPQCQKHETPACFPCSVHAMLLGKDQERTRILEIVRGLNKPETSTSRGMISAMEREDARIYNLALTDLASRIEKDPEVQ